MPLRIKPRKERRSNGVYWVVSLGRKYTGGCRQRRYFGSRKEAKAFVAQSEEARHRLGCEAFILPMGLRAEAMACSQRLKPLNATLTQAVEFFIRNAPRAESAKSIEELNGEFLKSRKAMNCRPRTIVQYESYLRVIRTDFGKVDVTSLLRQDIEDWLEESEWSPRTRKNYLVTLTTILSFAVGKGYRADNPAASIERPILDDRPVGILAVEQVRRLLRVAKEFDPEMLPALAIGLFAGLRRSEFFALDWSEIDHEHRTIEVKGIKAKTRQRRLVSVAANLLAWLNPHRKTSGAISPARNIDVFSERLHELAVKAETSPWPHNAMRHSFGSYFLGKTKDENLTASEMGNSPEVIIKHYRALVRDADVTRYWGLAPGNVQEESASTPTLPPAKAVAHRQRPPAKPVWVAKTP
ncbi:MAG: site-specific integrase [Verrucomicrobiota bacterium]|jgi:integrase